MTRKNCAAAWPHSEKLLMSSGESEVNLLVIFSGRQLAPFSPTL